MGAVPGNGRGHRPGRRHRVRLSSLPVALSRQPTIAYPSPKASNRSYATLGLSMVRDALAREPRLYAMGMGGWQRPLPQMLKRLHWKMSEVPFYFKVVHPWRLAPYSRDPYRRFRRAGTGRRGSHGSWVGGDEGAVWDDPPAAPKPYTLAPGFPVGRRGLAGELAGRIRPAGGARRGRWTNSIRRGDPASYACGQWADGRCCWTPGWKSTSSSARCAWARSGMACPAGNRDRRDAHRGQPAGTARRGSDHLQPVARGVGRETGPEAGFRAGPSNYLSASRRSWRSGRRWEAASSTSIEVTATVRFTCNGRDPMQAHAIMYHDVVENGDFESSGFPGEGAHVEELRREDFERHLDAIAAAAGSGAPCANSRASRCC